jgi:hypothetical protein
MSIHPHIPESGSGCLGSLEELISFSLAHCEYDSIVMAILGYLQTANIDDIAGKGYTAWDAYKDGVLYERGESNEMSCAVCSDGIDEDTRYICEICGDAVCSDCCSDLNNGDDGYVCNNCKATTRFKSGL